SVDRNLVVHDAHDGLQLLGLDRLHRGEVKAEAVGRDERAGLADILAEDDAKGLVQQVGRGVVTADLLATLGIDACVDGLADADEALLDGAAMDVEVRRGLAGVVHVDVAGLGVEITGVADLAAGLAIERRAVEDDLDLLASLGALERTVRAEDGDDGAVRLGLGVTEELGTRPDLRVEVGAIAALRLEGGAGAAGLALAVHGDTEAVLIDGEALLGGHLGGELQREAVSVVEAEGLLAGDDLLALLQQLGGEGLETVDAHRDGAAEARLLVGDDLQDLVLALAQLRIGIGELVDNDLRELRHELRLDAEEVAVADRLAEHAAQDVAAALVPRENAVADEEDGAAGVVGDDAERLGLDRVDAVGDAGQLTGALDDVGIEVGLVHRARALHEKDEALEAHAGIDARLVQRGADAVCRRVVLHEHVVPQLEVAGAIAAGSAIRLAAAPLDAAIHVDLTIGAVGAGRAGRPPVVLQLEDALFGDADLVAPDLVGLVVLRVDRRVKALGREAAPLGEELPGPGEGFLLEVVADREVTQHEEEGAVGLVSNLVDIDGAEALLDGAHPLRWRGLQPEEVRDHLLHAGGGEEDGLVLRRGHERRAGNVQMVLGLEEVDEHLAELDAGPPVQAEIGRLLGRHGDITPGA